MFSLPFSPHHSATLLITYTILSLLTIITLSMAYNNHCDARDGMLESTLTILSTETDGRTNGWCRPTYLPLFCSVYFIHSLKIVYDIWRERRRQTQTHNGWRKVVCPVPASATAQINNNIVRRRYSERGRRARYVEKTRKAISQTTFSRKQVRYVRTVA